MSDVNTLARPYAKAIFELALEQKTLPDWSANLKLLAEIASNIEMQPLLRNPLISAEQMEALFINVAGESLSEEAINLLKLLATSKRLNLLPSISKVYEACLAEQEKIIQVKVVSAFQLDNTRLQKLQQALEIHFNRQVIMQLAIDKSILGGAIVYADDSVIDGSIRGKLNRLSERLCS